MPKEKENMPKKKEKENILMEKMLNKSMSK